MQETKQGSDTRERGGVYHGQVANLRLTQRDRQSFLPTFSTIAYLLSPVHLAFTSLHCVMTQEYPERHWFKHRRLMDLNPGPSYFEVIVLLNILQPTTEI